MNRLGFADFHKAHFGPEQKAYWNNMLQQQQQQFNASQPSYQDQNDTEEYDDNEDPEYDQDDLEELQGGLTKEAIEIFRFSEAYRKEKELARLEEEKDDQEGMQAWQYNESTVHVSGGLEAPATSLVLIHKVDESISEKNRIQESLLNSFYMTSCQNQEEAPIVLWPVLPFNI